VKRILIAEDNNLVASIYQRKFFAQGFQVDVAADGECAIRCFKHRKPDVVLLDLKLPKKDGLDVLRRIRAKTTSSDLPVIILSEVYSGDMLQEAKEAGANQIMSKSDYRPDQVVQEILDTLGILSDLRHHCARLVPLEHL